jgi:glycosyltransferase involved in cell wall biosynthesis
MKLEDRNKILFVGHRADRTGAPILLLHLLRWLRENTELRFELLLLKGGGLESEFRKLGPVTVLHRPIRAQRSVLRKIANRLVLIPFETLRRALIIKRYRRKNDIRVVFFNSTSSAPLLEVAAKPERSAICFVHELADAFERDGLDSVLRLFRRSDPLIAVSDATRNDIARLETSLESKIQIIHGGISIAESTAANRVAASREIREELEIPDDAVVVGACGPLNLIKGTDLFVQLAQRVRDKNLGRPIHFVWIGGNEDGLDRIPFERDAAQMGLTKILHFTGPTPDPKRIYAAMDLFALTSRSDSAPLVCFEAAANALPILCFSGGGGAPEFVEGGCGIISPHLDVDRMSDAIVQLADSEIERRTLGDAARAKASKNHDVSVVMPKVAEILARQLDC